ncbi:MAG: hypothetical protein LUE99_07295 [Bacteroides sp.]|nr:hypothetical protein [Bacteroides sp.]
MNDGSGKILWSWHIWKTHFDLAGMPTQTYVTNPRAMNTSLFKSVSRRSLVMMDRNLGAADNTPSNTDAVVKTFGLFYQYGHKDPFPHTEKRERSGGSSKMIDIFGKNGLLLDHATLMDINTYNVLNSSIATDAKSLILYSIQNPLAYIRRDDNDASVNPSGQAKISGNWIYGAHPGTQALRASNQLWGYDFDDYSSPLALNSKFTGKTIYDPCPAGWCIAPQDAWINFTTNTPAQWNSYNLSAEGQVLYFNCVPDDKHSWEDGVGKGFMLAKVFGRRFYINGTSGETAFYPAAGCRFGKDGVVSGVGFGCYSWSTSYSATSEGGGYFLSTVLFLHPLGATARSYAIAVHYVKEASL